MVVLIALGFATIPWAVTDSETAEEWLYTSLVLLVTACPCALVISTPITYVCALALAAKKGILIKGGIFLEQLGRLSIVCIDKTGTLTEGRFRLTELLTVDGVTWRPAVGGTPDMPASVASALRMIASAEDRSSHPLAAAIVKVHRAPQPSPPCSARGMIVLTATPRLCGRPLSVKASSSARPSRTSRRSRARASPQKSTASSST